jgi:hypothetical protein
MGDANGLSADSGHLLSGQVNPIRPLFYSLSRRFTGPIEFYFQVQLRLHGLRAFEERGARM